MGSQHKVNHSLELSPFQMPLGPVFPVLLAEMRQHVRPTPKLLGRLGKSERAEPAWAKSEFKASLNNL